MKWKWGNVPIPVQYLLGLIVGAILQFVLKPQLFAAPWIGVVIGLPLIVAGVALAVWSVLEAGNIEVEPPNSLLTSGPYSYSRNPMYLAWILIYLGTGLATNSLWIIALFPIVVAVTHFYDIRKEERFLEVQFGDEYLQYKGQVRRYF